MNNVGTFDELTFTSLRAHCRRRGESYPLGVSKLVHSFRLSVCLMFASDPKREAQNTDSCPPIILQVKSKEVGTYKAEGAVDLPTLFAVERP